MNPISWLTSLFTKSEIQKPGRKYTPNRKYLTQVEITNMENYILVSKLSRKQIIKELAVIKEVSKGTTANIYNGRHRYSSSKYKNTIK